MLLADSKYFTREHYETCRGFAPPYLAELVVHCLELVSQLSWAGLPYRFKGGNSQLILLENPQRFSIDVDIVSTVSKEDLKTVLEKITEQCDLFHQLEVRPHLTKPWLPMISFKLYFNSQYQNDENAFVMLDAVLEAPPYQGIRKQVKCMDIYQSNESVEVPTIAGLLADKMLTLGPSTLGIPLGKNKEAHRLKHVYDVNWLLQHDFDKSEMLTAIQNCINQENNLQRSNWTLEQILKDTILFCEQPLTTETKPDPDSVRENSYLYEIAFGFDEFSEHLFRNSYTWQNFRTDCKRIADFCAKLLAEV